MGEEGSVEGMWYEVLRIFGWQDKWVVVFLTYFLGYVLDRIIMVTVLAYAWTLSQRNNSLMYFTLFLCNSNCGSWQLEVFLSLNDDWLIVWLQRLGQGITISEMVSQWSFASCPGLSLPRSFLILRLPFSCAVVGSTSWVVFLKGHYINAQYEWIRAFRSRNRMSFFQESLLSRLFFLRIVVTWCIFLYSCACLFIFFARVIFYFSSPVYLIVYSRVSQTVGLEVLASGSQKFVDKYAFCHLF